MAPPPAAKAGFTVVEIMVVVLIIGIIASIALPAFVSVRYSARNSALMNDLRTFSGAFELYILETGAWPSDQNRGILPPEMKDYVMPSRFAAQTPIGGFYDWDPDSSSALPGGIMASISVRSYTADSSQIQSLLDGFDDGNASTGQLREDGGNLYFVLQ